jgi:hypothetical protein
MNRLFGKQTPDETATVTGVRPYTCTGKLQQKAIKGGMLCRQNQQQK